MRVLNNSVICHITSFTKFQLLLIITIKNSIREGCYDHLIIDLCLQWVSNRRSFLIYLINCLLERPLTRVIFRTIFSPFYGISFFFCLKGCILVTKKHYFIQHWFYFPFSDYFIKVFFCTFLFYVRVYSFLIICFLTFSFILKVILNLLYGLFICVTFYSIIKYDYTYYLHILFY